MNATKTCSRCRETRPVDHFNNCKAWKDGRYPQCKPCRKEYRVANKERRAESYNDWYQRNLERTRAAKRQWYFDNLERSRATNKKWYQEHPEYNRANQARRRAQKAKTLSDPKGVKAIYELSVRGIDIKCYLCGKVTEPNDRHVDHVIPLSMGGNHSPDNLAIACSSCNLKKGSKRMEPVLNQGGPI